MRNQNPECPHVSMSSKPTQLERVSVFLVVCRVYCKENQNIQWFNRGILPNCESKLKNSLRNRKILVCDDVQFS